MAGPLARAEAAYTLKRSSAVLSRARPLSGRWRCSMTSIARRIVRTALEQEQFYPDEIDFSNLTTESLSQIGCAFQKLVRSKIIVRTGVFDRSQKPSSCGRTIFEYKLVSVDRAKAFLT